MRKTITLCALACIMGLTAAPASAIFAIGVHAGMDLNDQDLESLVDEGLGDAADTHISLQRNAIDAPLMGGLHILFDIMPLIDVELGFEASFSKYDVVYSYTQTGGISENFEDEAYFGRATAYVSGKFNLVNLPLLKAYGGAGVGYHFVAPLVSKPLLQDYIVDQGLSGDEIGVDQIVESGTTTGFHLLAGIRAKPPLFPFALTFEGRYFMISENDYGDDTNNFLAVAVGLEFGI